LARRLAINPPMDSWRRSDHDHEAMGKAGASSAQSKRWREIKQPRQARSVWSALSLLALFHSDSDFTGTFMNNDLSLVQLQTNHEPRYLGRYKLDVEFVGFMEFSASDA
jgi:hypothetical protein